MSIKYYRFVNYYKIAKFFILNNKNLIFINKPVQIVEQV